MTMPTNSSERPVRVLTSVLLLLLLCLPAGTARSQDEDTNKAFARRFYEQVWFSRNPAAVDELVAPEYVVHDVGDRKGVTEPAEEQKRIADFFWQHGNMTGSIDFQIAEGDLVATRWQWNFQPRAWWMKALNLGARRPIPIINVFRFREGKIVEIWNHRHDIDTGFANFLFIRGFGAGLVSAAVLAVVIRSWRKRRGGPIHDAPRAA